MNAYANEAAFSRALVLAMRRKGYFVQRIESAETGRGIPDIYCIIAGHSVWIELKRIHGNIQRFSTIPWRPGQQAWLHTVCARKQIVMTLACFDNGILQIQHNKLYCDNIVDTSITEDCCTYKDIKEVLQ